MTRVSPIDLCQVIERKYRDYLTTTFAFRDEKLRTSFEAALREGTLTKGPYLQATPTYKQGNLAATVFESIAGGPMEPEVLDALMGGRHLFSHQEKALRKIQEGRNIVVSTGTGSGKTESFLLPIVMHLYSEHRRQSLGPGVRALVLYPMNALANDQRDRLAGAPLDASEPGGLLYRLRKGKSKFSFTFGQYIGETPENASDRSRNARDAESSRLAGELVFRDEMRASPPNVLLTNFSMLEYLLLRPNDSALFDDGNAANWTYIVLDEAHQYRGSKGAELAMLLRRLKQRLRAGGAAGNFRCIATSASLVNGERDKTEVAQFASDLFDEPFEEEDVILGESESVAFSPLTTLGPEDYSLLLNRDEKRLTECLARFGRGRDASATFEQDLADCLLHDQRAASLSKHLAGGPAELATLTETITPDVTVEKRADCIDALARLLMVSKTKQSNLPLLRLRYHFFMRALEGAFLNFRNGTEVTIDKRDADGFEKFELSLCRECGQHYIVGQEREGKLAEAARDPSGEEFGATFYLPAAENEDLESLADEDTEKVLICKQCAAIGSRLTCTHNMPLIAFMQPAAENHPDRMKRCGRCSYSVTDPVRELVYGGDGPQAVIATSLYSNLPKTSKKILAFADSRQEAAYFAWFLDNSYKDLLSRQLLLSSLRICAESGADSPSMKELGKVMRGEMTRLELFPESMGDLEKLQKACTAIFAELFGVGQRNSLQGTGLARWHVKLPKQLGIPSALLNATAAFSEKEATELVQHLLGTAITDRAVEVKVDAAIAIKYDDLGIKEPQSRLSIGQPRGKSQLASWDGPRGRRHKYLVKLLVTKGIERTEAGSIADSILRELWDAIQEFDLDQAADGRLFLAVEDGRRLNSDWIRISPVAAQTNLYNCSLCSTIVDFSINGVCPRYGCKGTLMPADESALAQNHYRKTYLDEFPGLMTVEEHTAQLSTDTARDYQRRFKEGKINVLSCSTTFELGVDLGDLDAVFLRNVPPEAFNYEQRVGRSGRRAGLPGFAITYCKRGPHDLYHFRNPLYMLVGKVSPPTISIQNPRIVQRHLAAVALSAFFRSNPERFKVVVDFLLNMDRPSGTADLLSFLRKERSKLEQIFEQVIPLNDSLRSKLGITNGEWINLLAGPESKLAQAEAEAVSDFASVKKLEQSSRQDSDYRTAEWAKRRAETIANEQLLSFLSRKTVIPKYGFPVDVVELDMHRSNTGKDAGGVELSRDLGVAISEFAPGSQLIANKMLWTVFGLKTVVDKQWTERKFFKCTRDNAFQQWDKSECEPAKICAHKMEEGRYVVPIFGFITTKEPPAPPSGRVMRVYSSRPYFDSNSNAAEHGAPSYSIQLDELIEVERTRPGKLTILSEGKKKAGFNICFQCGAGQKKKGKKAHSHQTPFGTACTGAFERAALGQELETDVLKVSFKAPAPAGANLVSFAHSLSSALVEGAADILEVPSSDLSSVVGAHQVGKIPMIILYDAVPGGAGLVSRLEELDTLRLVLDAAKERVSGACGCGYNASCYGCLRTYRNQYVHQQMERGPVFEYLEHFQRQLEQVMESRSEQLVSQK